MDTLSEHLTLDDLALVLDLIEAELDKLTFGNPDHLERYERLTEVRHNVICAMEQDSG